MNAFVRGKWKVITACTLAAVLYGGMVAAADKPVRWKMQSWFPTKMPSLGTQAVDISKSIAAVSDGNIQIRPFEPGALVPPTQCFDAVSGGSVDLCWGASGYYYGKHPALAIFSGIPFGPEWPELLAYFYNGGGKAHYEGIYERNNIKGLMCGGTVAEASGWFRKEIKTLDDLKGLKMRFYGLGAKAMEKLGVSTQLIPAGEIYQALELGTIDATELAMPSVDLQLGLYQVAKHYYFPGWHQPATLYELIINADKWNALSKTQQAQIETMCEANIRKAIADGEAAQPAAMKEMADKGVMFHQWSPEIMAAIRQAWEEVVVEESEASAEFKKIYDHYADFRQDYKTWHDLSSIKQ